LAWQKKGGGSFFGNFKVYFFFVDIMLLFIEVMNKQLPITGTPVYTELPITGTPVYTELPITGTPVYNELPITGTPVYAEPPGHQHLCSK
jgi:hypothetical protein